MSLGAAPVTDIPAAAAIADTLVLGASGFVGQAVLRAVAEQTHLRPIAGMRRRDPAIDRLGIETRPCDAADSAALARALEGVGFAVNCVLGSPAVMVAATRNLCDAARTVGLRRIVHLSSMAVYGAATGVVTETAPLRPDSPYGKAKAECEAIVRSFVTSGGDAVVIRPGCVYGPGGEQWVGRIARWLQAGRLGDLGDMGGGFCNLTVNHDLAASIVMALTAPGIRGEVFNMADPDPGTWNQYFVQLARAIGAPLRPVAPLRMQLEANVLAPPLQVAKLLGQRIGLAQAWLPAPIPPSLLRLWHQPMRLDSRKIDRILRLQRTDPGDALSQAARWFREAASRTTNVVEKTG